jgi:hypothetical protein
MNAVSNAIGLYSWTDENKTAVEKWQPVVAVNLGGGYDWDDLYSFYDPEAKRFKWVSGSGCSCNSISDEVYGPEDFEDGDKEALKRAVRSHYEGAYNANPGDLVDDLAAVSRWEATA